MRTPLALSESGGRDGGGVGGTCLRSLLTQATDPLLPLSFTGLLCLAVGLSGVQLPCAPRQHGALLGVHQTPWALCAMPVPRLARGWGLGLLFCFFFWWKLFTVPSVAPANPLSAFSATLLSCLSRFLFFNFLH